MNRKDFFLLLCSGSALIASSCKKEDSLSEEPPPEPNEGEQTLTYMVADLSTELLTIGSIKQDGVKGIFVERIATGNNISSFRHFSLACTHSGCIIAHQPPSGEFHCPCHGSKFNSDGTVLNGPAARPLDRFVLYIDDLILSVKNR